MRYTISEKATNGKNSIILTRHIGTTTYRVRVHLPEEGTETMEDKILRMIQNDSLENAEECATMNVPQMSCQSERNAL